MNIQIAAKATALIITTKVVGIVPARNEDNPISLNHALWMLDGITTEYIQHEKAERWLGWAQCVVHTSELATLNELKQINKDS